MWRIRPFRLKGTSLWVQMSLMNRVGLLQSCEEHPDWRVRHWNSFLLLPTGDMSSSHLLLLVDFSHLSLDQSPLFTAFALFPVRLTKLWVYISLYPKILPLSTYRFLGLNLNLMRDHLVRWRSAREWTSSCLLYTSDAADEQYIV